MKPNPQIYLSVLFAVIIGLLLFQKYQLQKTVTKPFVKNETTTVSPNKNCVPTFVDGGGPYYKENAPYRSDIASDETKGERLIVSGRILRRDCQTAVSGATIDIWQADETGNYQEEWYRGKVTSDTRGQYTFSTIIPKGYGEGTGYRPPHIHFKVFVDNAEVITSQMFFPEVKGRPGFEDDYIMSVETRMDGDKPIHYGSHDIVLP